MSTEPRPSEFMVILARLRRIEPAAAIAGLVFAAGLMALGVELPAERRTQTGVALEQGRITALERLLSGLKDLETGERGYVLIGRDEYLEPYFSGNAVVDAEIKILAAQRGGIPRLGPLIEAKRAVAARVIAARREQGQTAAQELIASDGDKARMDDIRARAAVLQEASNQRIGKLELAERQRSLLCLASRWRAWSPGSPASAGSRCADAGSPSPPSLPYPACWRTHPLALAS